MRTVSDLLLACGTDESVLPPTALFNEGWLLRLALEAYSHPAFAGELLAPAAGAQWFSEGLLPSQFLPRTRGDPLGEGWTHADAVVGHVAVSRVGRSEVSLAARGTQFVVTEAKLGSPLSAGTTRAPFYNQAARNVACISEVLHRAHRPPSSLLSVAFVVLAPRRQIGLVVLPELLSKRSLRATVEKRVAMYAGEPDGATKRAWFEQAFLPLLDRLIVEALSWESVIERASTLHPEASNSLDAFYQQCLRFNPVVAG